MGLVGRVFAAVGHRFVEGNILRSIREFLDEFVGGRVSRFILLHSLKSQQNKVFFHTQEDKYCCNPKYICEEFRKRGLDVDMVWRIRGNDRAGIPDDCRVVNGGTYQFFKEMFTSKYIIANSVLWVKKGFTLRKDQVLIQTWHGSLGFKNFGKKDYKGSVRWVRGAIRTGKLTKFCVTNSSFVSNSLRNTYWPNTPMMEYGHPRNDIMFDGYAERRKEIKKAFLEQYGIDASTHLVMYGPTFRDGQDFSNYHVNIDLLLDSLRKRFGGEWKVLLRYHSALRNVYQKKNFIHRPDVVDVTDYPDMQELITIADVAITDYSSWILDFVLQRKPGFLYAPDMHDYEVERGLNYPLTESPFPVAENSAKLSENILNFDEDHYKARVEEFLQGKGCIEDGHASERVVDKILEMMKENGYVPKQRKGR